MSDQDISEQILEILKGRIAPISSLQLAKLLDVDHQKVTGIIKSIVSQASVTTNNYLKVEQKEFKKYTLTEEGKIILDNGSHEARIFQSAINSGQDGIDQPQLLKSLPDQMMAKAGFAKAMSNGWIQLDKETRKVKSKVSKIDDKVHELIKDINSLTLNEQTGDQPQDNSTITIDPKIIADFKKRKLITETLVKYMMIERGSDFDMRIEKPELDLTANLILTGEWKNKKFKDYNFNSLGIPPERGHLHPLLKVREQFRQIFLEMGFAEMPTNNYVENSFWNFDTLVVPQAHPARDSQDTFFISEPKTSKKIEDKNLVKRVAEAHHGSVDGSWPKGYRYDWSEVESSKNVLRTHTTAVSARILYKLANEHKLKQQAAGSEKKIPFAPAKLFSIDRVFRNETLDATHLAEFNQVEGVVMDEGLTLGDLMGVLRAFFEKLGIGKLRFKPAYNPYTEPSMEVFSYHSGLKKWVEIGNSGVFRPEMLYALGLPENVSAIAWGLSLERPTMIKYKIDNIRELVGHKVNIQMVQDSTLCLF